MDRMQAVGHTVLDRARVRLDCTCMLLHRALMDYYPQTCYEDDINFYMCIDSSPQHRGLELFAVSVDIVVNGEYSRRLWPLISIEHHMLDTLGKCIAVLWCVFLMVGPTFSRMQWFCRRVRSITHDMGPNGKCIRTMISCLRL